MRTGIVDLRRSGLIVAVAAALIVGACEAIPASITPTPSPPVLPAWNTLDPRWGAYLPEREWGNPREAVGGNGWGINWLRAIDTPYRMGEDGIAGLSDDRGEMQFAWAFWDGQQRHITERLNGATNPEGEYGETVYEDRIFHEATPTHSYLRYTYRYPHPAPQFEVEIAYAKVDSRTLVAQAVVKRIGAGAAARLYLLPKAWFHSGGSVLRLDERTFDLAGAQSHFVVLAERSPAHWQIVANDEQGKGAFDRTLRSGAELSDSGQGNIGMFEYDLDLTMNQTATLRFALAEAAATDQALASARLALESFEAMLRVRRSEAQALYRDDVTQHQDVYQSALHNLLWNQMLYSYDGSFQPAWQGDIDFHHVLIMPDKWEFPWLAGWDTGFQAVAAIRADVDLAKQQLRLVLGDGWQSPNGHVPCTEWMLETECPPVFAWAAKQVYQADGDADFLREIYPRLERHYEYWTRAIQVRKSDLYAGGFMGMDNIPRGDSGSPQADASAWMALFARDMAELADILGRPDRAQFYRAQRDAIAQAINETLWDAETDFYYDCANPVCSDLIRVKSLAGLIPLIAGVAPPDRLEEVMAHLTSEGEFWSRHGVRSIAADESIYEPGYSTSGWKNSNWSGPIWMPINYLLVQALTGIDTGAADELRANLIRTVEDQWQADGRFYEYYNAETGAGLGADHQTGWTALVANLIYEKYK